MLSPSTLPPTRRVSGLRQRKRPASEPKSRFGEYPGLIVFSKWLRFMRNQEEESRRSGITMGSISCALECKLQTVKCLTLVGTEG